MDKVYDAEVAILSCILKNSELLDEVSETLTADSFLNPKSASLFALFQSFDTRFDMVSIMDKANDSQLAYLNTIAGSYASPKHLKSYVSIVDAAERERILERGLATLDSQKPLDDRIQAVERLLASAVKQKGGGLRHAGDYLGDLVGKLEKRLSGESDERVKTGFRDLDALTGGFGRGDFIVIAGRPSMGKTAFMLNIAANMSKTRKVAVFSLEMNNDELVERIVCSEGRINTHRMRDGDLSEDDYSNLVSATIAIKNSGLMLDDSTDWSIPKMASAFRRAVRKGAEAIFFDYIQLVSDGSQNRVGFLSELTRMMKKLAKELGVPIVGLSQLNRSLETRTNKRPMMSDLRESGSIEQDADKIFMLYRDEVYNKNSEHKGTADLIVGKNRQGEKRDLIISSHLQFSRFDNFDGKRRPLSSLSGMQDYAGALD